MLKIRAAIQNLALISSCNNIVYYSLFSKKLAFYFVILMISV